jgi:glycosyltransferase involved in cell wall biosynthesis
MDKVNILLSTYNGEKYLAEQIESLLEQTYFNIDIYIRDDGSSDTTTDIISNYKSDNRHTIKVIEDNQNLGYPDCFWRLLEVCEDAEYYAFCDQDDVWKPNKIEKAVDMLREKEAASLYFHDYNLCDKDMKEYGYHTIEKFTDIKGYQLIFYTIAQGFSMVINDKMRRLLISENPMGKGLPHDGWCIWNAYYFGNIVYDPTVLASYRRHDNTVTSSGSKTYGMVKSWIDKEIMGDETSLLEKRASMFLKFASDVMPKSEQEVWETLIFKNKGIANYLKRLFYPKRLKQTLGGELALRILFLLAK